MGWPRLERTSSRSIAASNQAGIAQGNSHSLISATPIIFHQPGYLPAIVR
jgi:hypothetical protein